nr:hypothetical protein [Pseudescherichia sp.]
MVRGNVKRWGELSCDPDPSVIEPVRSKSEFSIAELVEEITADNQHELVEWGKPKGKETW